MKVKEFLRDPRGRVIVATIGTAAILLILVVMLIVNIVSSNNKHQIASENNDVAISNPVEIIDDTATTTDNTDATDKNVEPVDNSDDAGLVTIPSETTATTTTPATTPAATTTATDDLPQTGPISALPIALLAGAATTYLLSRKQNLSYNC